MAPVLRKSKSKSLAWTRAFALGILTVGLILALGSYFASDPSFSTFSSAWKHPKNVLGYVGSWTADSLFQLFGFGAWALPLLLFVSIARWMARTDRHHHTILGMRWVAAVIVMLITYGLASDLSGLIVAHKDFPMQGLLGIAVAAILKPIFGDVGSYLLVAALLWAFCMVWWEDLPMHIVQVARYGLGKVTPLFAAGMRRMARGTVQALHKTGDIFSRGPAVITAVANKAAASVKSEPKLNLSSKEASDSQNSNSDRDTEAEERSLQSDALNEQAFEGEDAAASGRMPLIRVLSREVADENTPRERQKVERDRPSTPVNWELPPMSLLQYSKKKIKGPSQAELIDTAKKITAALKSFEIDGEVVEISPGPIITMYEFQPGPGVRVQRIISAATDLAMSLGAPSVRIVAPIPGKSVAGIEVPNIDREEIVLRDVYENTRERAAKMRVPLTLGKDAEGKPVCEDLARMPHLLVGGATSMGKSVLVNSILTGLLCRFTPNELRIIIVDPKLVEFKVFEDIPHLLLPIVNDAADASQALKWAVTETKRRYVSMQKYSAKNIESYNNKMEELQASGSEEVGIEKFSSIVIIIDELAELMFTAKKDVEQSIVRLTQLARAAGIHLIMATQRPSADVVTGLIKSNCPSRAALRVASSSDSRIILDCTGAEQLLGRGDMFFTNTGPMGLRRMQSCYVSDEEIEKVCDFWRSQGEPEYREEILASEPDDAQTKLVAGEVDALYDEVLEFAREKGKISTSLIQRRFQIGYSRAARVMEQLELNGVVGEQQSAGKPREVIA